MNALPLRAVHARAGAIFGERAGWEVPLRYGEGETEYRALRDGLAVSDLSCRGKVRVTGADRAGFLHNMLTNDIKSLRPGGGCYAALLTDRAKVVSDMIVLAYEDSFLLDLGPEVAGTARRYLEKYIIADDVALEDRTAAVVHVRLSGPKAGAALADLCGGPPPEVPPFGHAAARIAGADVEVVRLPGGSAGSGEAHPSVDLLCPTGDADRVWEGVVRAGAAPAGNEAREARRIEEGIPRVGVDVDESALVLEAGLLDAVSFTKGCFLGQEIVARVVTHGRLTRRLVGLTLEGRDPAPSGEKLTKDGREVGSITSSAYSPSRGKAAAIGYIIEECAGVGTALRVGNRDAVVAISRVTLDRP